MHEALPATGRMLPGGKHCRRHKQHQCNTTAGFTTPLPSLPPLQALDATKGMLYLHMRNTIHRDLKSPNLLVDSAWRVKVGEGRGGRSGLPAARCFQCSGHALRASCRGRCSMPSLQN